jgi:hypothetical protein
MKYEGVERRSEECGFCSEHSDRDETLTSHDQSIVSMRTERKVIAAVALSFALLVAYVYNTNSSSISNDLKDIKAFMVASRDNDAEIKGRLSNLEWRIKTIEGEKK